VLVDDKPLDVLFPKGRHTSANWRQVVFDAPYNQQMTGPRMMKWSDWEQTIMPLFGKIVDKSIDGYPDEGSEGELKDEYTDILGNLTIDANSSPSRQSKKHLSSSSILNRSILVPAKDSMSHDISVASTESNYRPLSTIRNAKELQHGIDLLYPSQEPLTPESIATIISGSYSLVNNDEDIDINRQSTIFGHHQSTDIIDSKDSRNPDASADSTTATTYEQKKKLLEGASDKRRMEYKKKMEDNQREEVHQAEETDGVHLFRKAYMSWFKKGKKDK